MNRVCISIDKNGNLVGIASDEPIRCFLINDHCQSDRVFEFTLGEGTLRIGAEHVRKMLRDDEIGHINDDRRFGRDYGPPKPPSRPSLKVIE